VSITDDIRSYLIENAGWRGTAAELVDDYPLLDDVIDSLGIFSLVSFIETKYSIEIDDDELITDNFETITTVARLVESKVGVA
jgi:acyl carrier protein